MTFPKISIITPSYNQGEFLDETIVSVLNQGYPNLEYIIIDGGSTDQSVDIIQKHQSQLTYWVSEKDKGQAEAINKGLVRVTGDIITWLNSDDILVEDALFKVAEHFSRHSNVSVICGKTLLFSEHKTLAIKGPDNNFSYQIFSGMAFPQPSAFFSREALVAVGVLDDKLHYGMDYDFFLRIALTGRKFVPVDDLLSKYRLHQSSKTVSAQYRFASEWKMIYNRFFNSIEFRDVLLAEGREFGLVETNSTYTVQRMFSNEEFVKSFHYFLYFQIVFLYHSLHDLETVRKMTDYLQKNAPTIFRDYQLDRVRSRAAWPKLFLKALRKIRYLWNFFR